MAKRGRADFDTESWWYSAVVVNALAYLHFRGSVAQFNTIYVHDNQARRCTSAVWARMGAIGVGGKVGKGRNESCVDDTR